MTKKERYKFIIDYFENTIPTAESELHFNNAYELLVAVILSAQCTDKRVNLTTPLFFKNYPTPQKLAAATSEEVFEIIRSISYPNNKAKHLVGMAQKLINDYNGEVPSTMEELQTLPGVGRKTANVILSVWFNKAAMAVDTHVFRVSARLGLTPKATTPLQTEMELTKNIPESKIAKAHHWLILHGRYTCKAQKPLCHKCGLTTLCNYHLKSKDLQKKNILEKEKISIEKCPGKLENK